MSVVTIDLRANEVTGVIPLRLGIEFKPLSRVEDPPYLILPKPFTVITAGGHAEVEVEDGPYQITELAPYGVSFTTIIDGDALYYDLPNVDPLTLDPLAEPVAAWDAALDLVRDRVAMLAPVMYIDDGSPVPVDTAPGTLIVRPL